jgi:WD40-like Beta Propeller Repeat
MKHFGGGEVRGAVRTGRRARRSALLAIVLALGVAGSARASYEPAQILSESTASSTEFQNATEPAISADGQWIAFEGENEGLAGVWERNLQTGAISPVATVSASSGGSLGTPTPTGPSVSASGQFIAFTSETDPDPTNIVLPPTNLNCPEVYLRNMAIPIGQPGAYTLVAELDGGSTPITFAGCSVFGQSGDLRIGGAQAAPGVALSADGQEVAFTVDSASNLGLPASDVPEPCESGTPPPPDTTCQSQVAVRNLATNSTTVASVTPQGTPTPNGGAYPSSTSYPSSGWGQEEDQAVDMNQVGDVPASTAAISADGSTVAWMGTNLPAQIPGGAGDVTAGMTGNTHLVDPSDPEGQEVEPLWRRISGAGAGQTERVLAGAGLEFYGYTGYYQQDSSANEAAIEGGSAEADPGTPALSANGNEVIVTSDAPSPARLAAIDQFPSFVNHFLHSDLYAVDMSNPAAPGVTPLTQITSDVASNGVDASSDQVSGTVADPAISPDGTEIAFETDRTQFSLGSPALVSPPVQFTQKSETYVVDLATGTLQLATSTYDGLAPDGSSGIETVDNAGDVAVESAATNLIYGNVNLDGPEIYLLGNTPPATAVATETLSGIPRIVESVSGPSKWALSASASARRTGTVQLRVSVPGAGVLRAVAAAQLPGRGGSVARKRIPFRPVGAARAAARRRSVVRFTLKLNRSDRRYAAGRRGLYARIAVRFSAAGHHALRATVPVTFRIRETDRSTAHRQGRR